MVLPVSSSIQVCTVSAGSVALMCRRVSSSKMSPVGVSDFRSTWTDKEGTWCEAGCSLPGGMVPALARRARCQRDQLGGMEPQSLLGPQPSSCGTFTFLSRSLFFLMESGSRRTRPRRASSMRMPPRRPEEMQSFQKEV